MYITRLVLEGYKNIHHGPKINRIEITPQSHTVLVLGGNGSGKSSLLKEWSVLPPRVNRFVTDGYKLVECFHEGQEFRMESRGRKSGWIHTFTLIKDGEEKQLNEDGKVTTQRQLVETYFNYDEKVHDLLTNERIFTKMGTEERHYWFTRCCPIDHSYTNALFKQVKGAVRDMDGTVKHLQNKESDIQQRLMQLEEEGDDVVTKLDNLTLELESFLPFKNADVAPTREIEKQIDDRVKALEAAEKEWKRFTQLYVPDSTIKNKSALSAYMGRIEASIENNDNRVNEYAEKLMKYTRICDSLESGMVDSEQLKARLTEIAKELGAETSTRYTDHDLRIQRIQTVLSEIVDLAQLFRGMSKDYGPTDRQKVEEQVIDTKRKLTLLQDRATALERQIAHCEEEGETATCPKCSFRFHLKHETPIDHADKLKAELASVETTIEKGRARQVELDEQLGEVNTVLQNRQRLNALLSEHQSLMEGWGDMTPQSIMETPMAVDAYGRRLIQAIKNDEKIFQLIEERKSLEKALSVREQLGEDPQTQMGELETKIYALKEENKAHRQTLDLCDRLLRMVNHFEAVDQRTQDIIQQLEDLLKAYTKAVIRDDAAGNIDRLYGQIGQIKEAARQKRQYDAMFDEIQHDRERIQATQKLDRLLMDCLSPKTGVPADQLSRFIQSFVDNMNHYIGQLWTTPMEILPCSMEKGTLNCRFPFKVEGSTVSEVAEGSSGQEELINLVFMITVRHFLGLKQFPLFLDEMGNAFDHTHRTKYLYFAKAMIDNGECTQLMIINHFDAISQSLHHHDTIVMDDRNIVVPKRYNKIADIETD